MTDFNALRTAIADSGMMMKAVASKAGITRPTLHNRMNGIGEFSAREITGLCNALHLSIEDRERIFFAPDVPAEGRDEK